VSEPNDVLAYFAAAPPRNIGAAPERARVQITADAHKERMMLVIAGSQLPVLVAVIAVLLMTTEASTFLVVLLGAFAASDTAFLWFAYRRWQRALEVARLGEPHRGIVRGVETKDVRRGESRIEVTEVFVSFTEHDAERWCKVRLSQSKPRPKIEVGMEAVVLVAPQRRRSLGVWAGNKFGRGTMIAKPHDIAEATAHLTASA